MFLWEQKRTLLEQLHNPDVFIGRTRRCIDDHDVFVSCILSVRPTNIAAKLDEKTVLLWAAQYYCVIWGSQHIANADNLQIIAYCKR